MSNIRLRGCFFLYLPAFKFPVWLFSSVSPFSLGPPWPYFHSFLRFLLSFCFLLSLLLWIFLFLDSFYFLQCSLSSVSVFPVSFVALSAPLFSFFLPFSAFSDGLGFPASFFSRQFSACTCFPQHLPWRANPENLAIWALISCTWHWDYSSPRRKDSCVIPLLLASVAGLPHPFS